MQAQKINPLRRIVNAFRYSCEGYKAAFKDEAAFRQVLILAVVLVIAAFILPLSAKERIILILPLFISLIVELLNSAIENIVDLASPGIHPLAKKAKDMGSAAQLTALVLIALTWCVVLIGRFL